MKFACNQTRNMNNILTLFTFNNFLLSHINYLVNTNSTTPNSKVHSYESLLIEAFTKLIQKIHHLLNKC